MSKLRSEPTMIDPYGRFKDDSRLAVIDSNDEKMTWAQYIVARNKIGNALIGMGVGSGIRVAVYGLNSVQWLLCRSAVFVICGVIVPINWHLVATEVAYLLENSDSQVLFVDEQFLPKLEAALRDQTYKDVRLRLCVVMNARSKSFSPLQGIPLRTFEELLQDPKASPLFPDMGTAVPGMFLYTGGTSGHPKAAVRSAQPLVAKDQENALWITKSLRMDQPDQVQLIVAPLYHAAPFGSSNTAQRVGGTMVLMRKFDAKVAAELIHRHRVTCFVTPPIILKQLVGLPQAVLQGKDFSSMQSIASVGAPCPQYVKEQALKLFGPCVREFYGSSELGLNTLLQPEDILRKPNSCGRVVPGCELRIFDDNGVEAKQGQPGTVYVKMGSATLVAYHKSSAKFQDSLLKTDPSWFTVGDVGYLDEENYLFICDRKIDMIISGGVKIYPAEIEAVLHAHPDIADVAVFGVPDDTYGERVHAAVQLKSDKSSLKLSDLRAFCDDKLAPYKQPKELSFHPDFPRTPSGKLIKRQLRDVFWTGKSKL